MVLDPDKNQCCTVKKRSADTSEITPGAWIKRRKKNTSNVETDTASAPQTIISRVSRKTKLPSKRYNVRRGMKATRNSLGASRHLVPGTPKVAPPPSSKTVSTNSTGTVDVVASGAFWFSQSYSNSGGPVLFICINYLFNQLITIINNNKYLFMLKNMIQIRNPYRCILKRY